LIGDDNAVLRTRYHTQAAAFAAFGINYYLPAISVFRIYYKSSVKHSNTAGSFCKPKKTQAKRSQKTLLFAIEISR